MGPIVEDRMERSLGFKVLCGVETLGASSLTFGSLSHCGRFFFFFFFLLAFFFFKIIIPVKKWLISKQQLKERRGWSALWFEGAVCHGLGEMVTAA